MWVAWEVQGMLLNGVQLSILVGRVVPSPASHELLDALQSVTVTVKDVGDRVAGAKVTFRGKTYRTNAEGKARIKVGQGVPAKRYTIRVRRSGYAGTSVRIKVI